MICGKPIANPPLAGMADCECEKIVLIGFLAVGGFDEAYCGRGFLDREYKPLEDNEPIYNAVLVNGSARNERVFNS